MKMRRILLFLAAAATVASCTKDPHRYIGHENGRNWIIDQMQVTISDDGAIITDTIVTSGTFRFSKTKNKDTNGSGTTTRFEFDGNAWSSAPVEEGFIWEMDGDNTLIIEFQDGRIETVSIDKSEKKSQEWTSTSLEIGDDVVRSYKLSLD